MPENPNQPRENDSEALATLGASAVLGGQAPPPTEGAVLGGIEGVKSRACSPVERVRIAALSEALNYGEVGLDLVIEALNDESKQVRRAAYLLLRHRVEPQVKQALREYKPWNLVERLDLTGYPEHVTTFANRKVEEFDPQIGITDPVGTAYALRCEYDSQEDITDQLAELLQDSRASQVEALVFGLWDDYPDNDSSILVNALVAAKDQLKSLKAVFIGEIISEECEISWIEQSDISPVLEAYPNLEVLQVRGGERLTFSPLRHDHLEALIVETGGLSRETIAQICALELPALEHLELWLGSGYYGGNSSVEDLMPILDNQVFPYLKYLGLRNSQYSDDIADAVVRSPLIEQIKVLDLSMGSLGDEGALALLNCPAVNQLDILNVSANFLSDDAIERLSQLNCQVIANSQKHEYEESSYEYSRYCSVAE